MSARSVAPARRLPLLAGVAALALGLAACGKVNNPDTLNNNGVYVQGGPITYQLQVSRELNQYSTEDSQYVKGVPPRLDSLNPQQIWYGVFLWGKNQTELPQVTSDNIDIVDTEGNHYYPIPIIRSLNGYAWAAQPLAPGATEPEPNTVASFGPTQGGLLLFKLGQAVYANRPLTLEIRGPSQQLLATISLDL